MRLDIDTVIHWIGVYKRLREAGQPAIDDVRKAFLSHGIDADNVLLDRIELDAARRQAIAHADATGVSDLAGGAVATGSTGD